MATLEDLLTQAIVTGTSPYENEFPTTGGRLLINDLQFFILQKERARIQLDDYRLDLDPQILPHLKIIR